MSGLEDAFPLAPMQQEILLHAALSPGTGAYLLQCRYDVRGPLDPARLARAWRQVARRHAVLRAAFVVRGGELVQEVHEDVGVPLQTTDLSGSSPEDQDRQLREHFARDRVTDLDVTRPPLMRLALFRLGEARHCLGWTVHHLLVDARSLAVVNEDLAAAYRGEPAPAPPPSFHGYVDWLGQQDARDSEAYWRDRLAGARAPTPLPGGPLSGPAAPAPGLPPQWSTHEARLSPAHSVGLHRFAAAHDVTVNTLLQAAWAMLLARYSGEHDVVFGAARACRRSVPAHLERVVGPLVHLLPVRVAVPPDAPLLPWLRDLRRQWVALRPHEHSGLRSVAAWAGLESPARLFASTVSYESRRYAATYRVAPGLDWDFDFRVDPPYPLTLWGFGGEDLLLRLSHDGAPGDAAGPGDGDARQWLRHTTALLEGMLADPERRLGEIPMLGDAERRRAVLAWNQPQATDGPAAPAGAPLCSVAALFERQAERTPQATALEWEEAGHAEPRRLTYQEVDRRATRLARAVGRRLTARAGGSEATGEAGLAPVGVMLERGPDLVCALLAVWKAGAPYVALDTRYPPARLASMAAEAGIGLLVTRRGWPDRLPGLAAPAVCLDEGGAPWPDGPGEADDLALHAGHRSPPGCLAPAYIVYTSGSSGRPKGIVTPHRGVANFLTALVRAYGIGPGTTALNLTSIGYDASVRELFAPLIAGGKVVLLSDEQSGSLAEIRRVIHRREVTAILSIVPSVLRALLDAEGAGGAPLSPIRLLLVSGEPLLWRDVARARAALGPAAGDGAPARVVNQYGPTECTLVSTHYEVPPSIAAPGGRGPGPGGIVPLGRPYRNVRLYLLDAGGEPVPDGAVGEIYIGGRGVTHGYLDRPELTAAAFLPDPFARDFEAPGETCPSCGVAAAPRMYRTGDRARRRADGSLEFLGRLDRQMKVRGTRVEPGEIEAVLGEHPAVRGAAVDLWPPDGAAADDAGADRPAPAPRLTAFVAVAPGGAPTAAELRHFLQARLPGPFIPERWVIVDALPRTASGKVDRGRLPRVLPDPDGAEAKAPPVGRVETWLAALWGDVLGMAEVGRQDDFFALGGASLSAMRLVNRIEQQAGLRVPLVTVFDHPTLAELARRLSEMGAEEGLRR